MHEGLKVLCWAVVAAFIGCAQAQETRQPDGAALAAERFEKGGSLPAWVEPMGQLPATELKGPAIVLLADSQFLVADMPAVHVHRASRANTTISLEQVAQFQVEFNPAYQHVQLHVLRIVRDGITIDRLQTSNVKFLQRETGLDRGVYTGNVTASILIPDLRLGDTLEYKYTVAGQNPVLGGRYVHSASWDQPWATELRRITLAMPAGRSIAWRLQGGDQKPLSPEESVLPNGHKRLRWEGRVLQRVEVEKDTPAAHNPYRYLHFSEFQDWNDVARWAAELFESPSQDVPEVGKLVAEFKTNPTLDEQVSAALAWVQKEVRYFSLSMGESSHRPATPGLTLERRFGDCKDKSALLIELLRGLGVSAQPVLISSQMVRGMKEMAASPHAFDHAIVRAEVDGKYYFLDPTRLGQLGRLDAMGQRWEGAEALVADKITTALASIAEPAAAGRTHDELSEKFVITKPGGEVVMDMRRTWSGIDAEAMRLLLAEATDDRLVKFFMAPYERRYPGVKRDGQIKVEKDTVNNKITAVMRLRVPSLLVLGADRWTANYEASNIDGVLQVPESSSRRQPLAMPFKRSYRYNMEMEWPAQVSISQDPAFRERRTDAFTVKQVSVFRGNRAATRLDVELIQPEVKPEKLADFAAAVRALRGAERGSYWVSKAVFERAPPARSLTAGEKNRAALESRTDTLTQNINSKRLQGTDLVNALCARSMALSQLGQHKAAIDDAEAAVKSNSNQGSAHICRGEALAQADRFAEAIEAYDTGIMLQPTARQGFFKRALARFYSGDLAAAADDFTKELDGPPAPGKQFTRLWQTVALKRLGRPTPPQWTVDAEKESRGEWPMPALAMLLGRLEPDEMLRHVQERKAGDDRELALTEAYFVLGQWHALNGRKDEAAAYFRKTRQQGILYFYEHWAARLELRALGFEE